MADAWKKPYLPPLPRLRRANPTHRRVGYDREVSENLNLGSPPPPSSGETQGQLPSRGCKIKSFQYFTIKVFKG